MSRIPAVLLLLAALMAAVSGQRNNGQLRGRGRDRECRVTGQRIPTCGTDGVTYSNMAHLNCVAKTTPGLRLRHRGRCEGGFGLSASPAAAMAPEAPAMAPAAPVNTQEVQAFAPAAPAMAPEAPAFAPVVQTDVQMANEGPAAPPIAESQPAF